MFKKLLIANRGEIARRVIRTAKRLGLRTVAIFSDADAEAPHVREADEALRVGPAPAKDSYLNIDAVLAAMRESSADAVHPGYGFLSENQEFAQKVLDSGAVFVGPPPRVLAAFGDKMRARSVALAAGVAPVPGANEPLDLSDEAGRQAAHALAAEVGYPVIVKAVGGGGGIGMQIVSAEAQLDKALSACANRGQASFADARVYLERYVERPRHIEVQIFCDQHGNAYALGERECSLQRRHQKIVEETPSPAPFFAGEAGQALRAKLMQDALKVVRHVGYVGAGTVEFVADASGALYFLEVNARLQVEHPVTEMVTGLDLVEWQLRVAAGEALPDWSQLVPRGHAIETRVYAEDPAKMFVPKPGAVAQLSWASGRGEELSAELRIESAIVSGSQVTPFYDPMVAKVVTWGEDREQALSRMVEALRGSEIAPLQTNLDFVARLLQDPEVRAGQFDTKFAEAFAKRKAAP